MSNADFTARRQAFRKLHESGCFVIPNPWDIGSAVYLKHLGFKALASTSAGFAFSRGKPDGAVTRDEMVAHIGDIVAATDLPVNADFESGYADTPQGVAESVRMCERTGVAALSIEDSTGDANKPLYELSEALERLHAAREALKGTGTLLVARAECFLVGHPDPLKESIKRLRAYTEAGADVLYAPGPKDREQIREIVAAVAPKPVNVLMAWNLGLRVEDLVDLGVRRISVGSGLARAAWGGFIRTAEELAKGSFELFGDTAAMADLNGLFRGRNTD
jgi:2-methylisocitrate lyase-like PEP mutase family enzyme